MRDPEESDCSFIIKNSADNLKRRIKNFNEYKDQIRRYEELLALARGVASPDFIEDLEKKLKACNDFLVKNFEIHLDLTRMEIAMLNDALKKFAEISAKLAYEILEYATALEEIEIPKIKQECLHLYEIFLNHPDKSTRDLAYQKLFGDSPSTH